MLTRRILGQPPGPPRWLGVTLWVIVLVIGGYFRWWGLGTAPLTVDEAAVVRDSRLPLGAIWAKPFRAPLPFSIMKLARLAGESEIIYRAPSALAGVLGIAAFMVLARESLGAHVAPAAGLLLALNAFHVGGSREAKYYAFVLLFATLAGLFLVRMAQGRSGRLWALWGFALVGAASIYTHGYGAAAVACQVPLAIWWWTKHGQGANRVGWKAVLPALALLVLATLPFVVSVIHARALGRPGGQMWGTSSMRLLDPSYYWDVLTVFGVSGRSRALTATALALGAVGMVLSYRRIAALVGLSVLGPLLMIAAVRPTGYEHRYLAASVPFVLITMVAAIALLVALARVARWRGTATCVALLVGAVVALSARLPNRIIRGGPDWHGLGEHLRATLQAGDVVVMPVAGVWLEILDRYVGQTEGVAVVTSSELVRGGALPDTVGSRFWIIRQTPLGIRNFRERLAGEYLVEDRFPGILVLERRGTATRRQCTLETARVAEVLADRGSRVSGFSTWPRRRAQSWTTVGDLYRTGGDTLQARTSYINAVREDSTYSVPHRMLSYLSSPGTQR